MITKFLLARFQAQVLIHDPGTQVLMHGPGAQVLMHGHGTQVRMHGLVLKYSCMTPVLKHVALVLKYSRMALIPPVEGKGLSLWVPADRPARMPLLSIPLNTQ